MSDFIKKILDNNKSGLKALATDPNFADLAKQTPPLCGLVVRIAASCK
jgi:hypothetical protein